MFDDGFDDCDDVCLPLSKAYWTIVCISILFSNKKIDFNREKFVILRKTKNYISQVHTSKMRLNCRSGVSTHKTSNNWPIRNWAIHWLNWAWCSCLNTITTPIPSHHENHSDYIVQPHTRRLLGESIPVWTIYFVANIFVVSRSHSLTEPHFSSCRSFFHFMCVYFSFSFFVGFVLHIQFVCSCCCCGGCCCGRRCFLFIICVFNFQYINIDR